MLIYKCDYCGAEYEFDGVGRVCPKCGAAIEAASDADPESLKSAAAEPIMVQLTEPIVIEATGGKLKKAHSRSNGAAVAKAVTITVLAMVVGFFIFIAVIAYIPYDDGSPEAAYNYTQYSEEGHSPGDAYTGDIKLSFDLTEYKMVSWTNEPVLKWGVVGHNYSADKLYIHARIHNNTDSKLNVDLRMDIIGKDGTVIKDNYISIYDLLEGQDALVEECLYIYLPSTYNDISEIKLTNCSITVN
jgi:hypothetical protein